MVLILAVSGVTVTDTLLPLTVAVFVRVLTAVPVVVSTRFGMVAMAFRMAL